MRSEPVEVKVGQVWRRIIDTKLPFVRNGEWHTLLKTRTLTVLEMVDTGRYGRAYPSARVHCAESGSRYTIALVRLRALQLVSDAPAEFALESRK